MLSVQQLHKSHRQGETRIDVLKGITLQVRDGETVAIVGASGGGKSTLLSMLSGVDRPDQGKIIINEQDTSAFDEDTWTRFRGQHYGIVFQQFHLIAHLTALENVNLALDILGRSDMKRAEKCLEEVGLSHRMHHRPSQLSGGEAQRVAIARALVVEPKILLADEPSGNLDQQTGEQVMQLLFDLVAKYRSTLVLVTHNIELAKRCERVLRLEGGLLTESRAA